MKKYRLIIILRLVLTGVAGDGLKSEILPCYPVFSFLSKWYQTH
jgi:hypothetical protein